jgi:hypothetical protein
MPYPEPNPELTIMKTAILVALREVPYLAANNGGTLEFVNDPKTAFDWTTYTPPTWVLVPAGARTENAETKVQDGCVFEERWFWTLYLVAANYDVRGSGVTDLDPNAVGMDAMIADARKFYGRTIMLTPIAVKLMPSNPTVMLEKIERDRIVYRIGFRSNWLINQ